jgi:hypothetical protein
MGARYWRKEASKCWRPSDFIVRHMDFVSECQKLILSLAQKDSWQSISDTKAFINVLTGH